MKPSTRIAPIKVKENKKKFFFDQSRWLSCFQRKNDEFIKNYYKRLQSFAKYRYILACNEGPGLCSHLLTICSVLLILVTLPLSLLYTVKVVQVGKHILTSFLSILVNWSKNVYRSISNDY